MDLEFRSAVDLIALLRAGEVTSVEILRHYIDRIETFDGRINAVTCRDFDRALESARLADKNRTRSSEPGQGPLHGLPLTVKESFQVSGLPTTWGMASQASNTAHRNADAVQRLLDAGAIVFGKTNVPEGLADCQTSNALYGTTGNPWDTSLTCGGSSGGSAAALAAGFTALELGSDLAGSLRIPAHFCGVFSHKPSYGLVPQTGHSLSDDLAQSDLTVIGPMARSAADLRLALATLAGPPRSEAIGWHLTLPPARHERLRDVSIAVLPSHRACRVDDAIETGIMALAETLRRLGARVDTDVEWPIDLEVCHRDYLVMTRTVGSRRSPPDLLKRWSDEAVELRSDDVGYRAALRRAAALTHHAWLSMHSRRSGFRAAWKTFFGAYDVVLCPVHPSLAFPHDIASPREDRTIQVDATPQDYNQFFFWMAIAGLSYLPATVRPIAVARGLPMGVQIIGPYLEDLTTLRVAELLEEVCPTLVYPLGATGPHRSPEFADADMKPEGACG